MPHTRAALDSPRPFLFVDPQAALRQPQVTWETLVPGRAHQRVLAFIVFYTTRMVQHASLNYILHPLRCLPLPVAAEHPLCRCRAPLCRLARPRPLCRARLPRYR